MKILDIKGTKIDGIPGTDEFYLGEDYSLVLRCKGKLVESLTIGEFDKVNGERFKTDLQSIPGPARLAYPKSGPGKRGATWHDWACETKWANWIKAANLYRAIMKYDGLKWLERNLKWAAVVILGPKWLNKK